MGMLNTSNSNTGTCVDSWTHSVLLISRCVALVSALLTGCASQQVHVSVDAISGESSSAKIRYLLFPGGNGVTSGDLQYQEFAHYVDSVLAEKGFRKAVSFDDSDIAIFLTNAIGDPETY